MSVLLEAINVVSLRSSVEAKYPGGLPAFERDCPNQTYCADDNLVRVGFMAPADVEGFVRVLASMGLVHMHGGKCVDLVVVDEHRGPTTPCDWIDGGRHPDGYSAAWLRDTIPGWFATPKGWKIGQSKQLKFFDPKDAESRVIGLAKDGDVEVILDLETGREGYIGRVPPPPRSDKGAS